MSMSDTDLSIDPAAVDLSHRPHLVKILGEFLLHVLYVRRQLDLHRAIAYIIRLRPRCCPTMRQFEHTRIRGLSNPCFPR